MKVIRPEYVPPKEEKVNVKIDVTIAEPQKKVLTEEDIAKIEIIEENTIYDKGSIFDEYYEDTNGNIPLIDVLMQQTIDENTKKLEITLTKRQYEQWLKKGGEKWLKHKLSCKK